MYGPSKEYPRPLKYPLVPMPAIIANLSKPHPLAKASTSWSNLVPRPRCCQTRPSSSGA